MRGGKSGALSELFGALFLTYKLLLLILVDEGFKVS